MAAHVVFLHLAAILSAACLCAEVAARVGVPSVVGGLLAEMGSVPLLFEVGPGTDAHRLTLADQRGAGPGERRAAAVAALRAQGALREE